MGQQPDNPIIQAAKEGHRVLSTSKSHVLHGAHAPEAFEAFKALQNAVTDDSGDDFEYAIYALFFKAVDADFYDAKRIFAELESKISNAALKKLRNGIES